MWSIFATTRHTARSSARSLAIHSRQTHRVSRLVSHTHISQTNLHKRNMSGVSSSGANPPVWLERDDLLKTSVEPTYPHLDQDISTDVLVVGGGMAGLHIAYELLKEGSKQVVLIEDGKIGSGETGRTTGHLSVDNEYNDFISLHGPQQTAHIANAQQAAIECIASIVQQHNIDCDFVRVPGYMFHGLSPEHKNYTLDTLHEIFDAASGTNRLDVKLVPDAGLKGFDTGKAIRYENQATFHPTKYVRALAKVVEELGGKFYEKTRFMGYDEHTGGVKVQTEDGKSILARALVLATNVPPQKLVMIDRLEAYRTYAVALKIATADVSARDQGGALWWDLGDPYHYIRVTPHKEAGYSLLVVGGEDEKLGSMMITISDISDWRAGPGSGGLMPDQWSIDGADKSWTLRMGKDCSKCGTTLTRRIAYIGRNPGNENVYVHTGDNGDGLTYAAIGGMVISSLINGRQHEWAHTFSPSRQHSTSHLQTAVKTIPSMIKENLSDQIYYAKWVTACTKTMKDIEDLVPDSGEVVREGFSPVAVYKDPQGSIHKMTAVCPHLKGIVVWNNDEKSFDCPIHGSRFTCKGQVVNGPAKGPLKAM